jgi:hypothetical protein
MKNSSSYFYAMFIFSRAMMYVHALSVSPQEGPRAWAR